MRLEPRGDVQLVELRELSRATHAGWRVDRLDASLWDTSPAETLFSNPERVVARDGAELAGAVAVCPDPVNSRLHGRDTWRVSAIIARDSDAESNLLAEASRTVADRDLLYFRFSGVGDAPARFALLARGVTFGIAIPETARAVEAQHPIRPDDDQTLVDLAREIAEHPPGGNDDRSLERSRRFNAEVLAAALANPGMTVVTRDSGRPTGFAALSSARRFGCIDLLGVAHSERRRGSGTRLVAGAIAVAQREGWRCLLVATSEENVAAAELYGKCGFQSLGPIELLRRPARAPAASADPANHLMTSPRTPASAS